MEIPASCSPGMITTVLADGGDISPFVPGGTGITASGAAVQTEGFNTGDALSFGEKVGKLERKIQASPRLQHRRLRRIADKTSPIKAAIKHRTSALQHC
ncbi:MAG: hypothetical protein U0168_28685 [Nannocystaceae bacterium]